MFGSVRPLLSLSWASVFLGTVVYAAGGIVSLGLVFPRQNATYAPTERFPIVFALQNATLAKPLVASVSSRLYNGSLAWNDKFWDGSTESQWFNFTSDTYFLYFFVDAQSEGPIMLRWQTFWRKCEEVAGQTRIGFDGNEEVWMNFEIRNGAPNVDLVAVTAREETCPANFSVSIEVTGTEADVWDRRASEPPYGTCAVVATSTPAPTANPCAVRIDQAVVASMEASDLESRCRGLIKPTFCPARNEAVQQFVTTAGVVLVFVFSTTAYLLV